MLKRSLDSENKENEQPSSSTEPVQAKKAKLDEADEEEDDDDEDEEDKGPWPIAGFLVKNDGQVHPTNKQYFIYENTIPSMVSQTARFWSRKYLNILPHVNPDAYNMYIHNDFMFYGELEILENCLLDLAKGIFLKRKTPASLSHLITTFRRVEALTIVLDVTDSFPMMDDGERFQEFVRLIGSCYVTVLRDLLPKSMFNDQSLTVDEQKKLKQIAHQLPNFHEVLQRALIMGRQYLTIGDEFSGYTNILHTVYCKWMLIIKNTEIDFDDKDNDISEALKHASGIPADIEDESFNFMKDLAAYSTNYPDLGGHSHDLRKWPKTKRDLYSFEKFDNDSDSDDFWLQL